MNEVGCHIDHVEYIINTLIPLFEKETFVFDGSEVHGAINSIDSAADKFEVVQLTELLFTEVFVNCDKLADSIQGESAIIFGNYSEVVLNEHPVELLAVGLNKGRLTVEF